MDSQRVYATWQPPCGAIERERCVRYAARSGSIAQPRSHAYARSEIPHIPNFASSILAGERRDLVFQDRTAAYVRANPFAANDVRLTVKRLTAAPGTQ